MDQSFKTKICSCGSIEKMVEMINKFYYSTNCVIDKEGQVFNTKLNKSMGHVEFKKGRFTYYA